MRDACNAVMITSDRQEREKKYRSSDRKQLDMRGVLGGTCDFLQ